MDILRDFIITLIIFFVIDITWINLVIKKFFEKDVLKIQGKPLKLNTVGALLSYLCLGIGIYYFGIRNMYSTTDSKEQLIKAVTTAGIFGILSYGIFDFTNLAIFSDYSWKTGLIDTLWGGFASTLTAFIAIKVINLIK